MIEEFLIDFAFHCAIHKADRRFSQQRGILEDILQDLKLPDIASRVGEDRRYASVMIEVVSNFDDPYRCCDTLKKSYLREKHIWFFSAVRSKGLQSASYRHSILSLPVEHVQCVSGRYYHSASISFPATLQ